MTEVDSTSNIINNNDNHTDMKKTTEDISVTDATMSATSSSKEEIDGDGDAEEVHQRKSSDEDDMEDDNMKDKDGEEKADDSADEDDGKSPEEKAKEAKEKEEAEKKRVDELKKKYANWPLRDIKEPHENDVMYGRGGE